jgi:hypothetical protein
MTYVLWFYLAGVAAVLAVFMSNTKPAQDIAERNNYGPFHMTVMMLIAAGLWPILLPMALSRRK